MRFSKAQRLLSSTEFQYVFDRPMRVRRSKLTLLFKPNCYGYARIGLVVAKKQFKHSVTRNRIKRKLRETFRLSALPAVDIVAIPKRGLEQLERRALTHYVEQTWERLVKVCEKR